MTSKALLRTTGRWTSALAGLAVGAVVLAGCAASDEVVDTNDGGLLYGAPVEDWVAATADMDPVTLVWQANSANESVTGAQSVIDAAAYIEEYSGGKIT